MIRAGSNGRARLFGDAGNDTIIGSDEWDLKLEGGDGNDFLYAGGGDDGWVTGRAGNDYVDGGAGFDFLDGGIGADTLVGGPGNDYFNPDIEFFRGGDPTDKSRDIIRITAADLGDFQDWVFDHSFEPGIDKVQFGEAVSFGTKFRIYYENVTLNQIDNEPDWFENLSVPNTVLQIDYNRNGFDPTDYFLVILDVTVRQEGSAFVLT